MPEWGKIMRLAFGLAASAIVIGCLSSASASESVAYQLDVAHDGNITISQTFTAPLKLKWKHNLGGSVSYPIAGSGMIFVTVGPPEDGGSAELYALDTKTGAVVWHKLLSGTYNDFYAAYDKGRLFVVNSDCTMQEFDATAAGKSRWSTQLPDQYSCSSPPTAYNGMVYTGGAGDGGTLYAVDEVTGKVKWTASVMNGDDSSPAIGDDGVYVSYPCQYYKFDPVSGKLIWNQSRGCEGGGGDTPVYFNNRVYVRDWSMSPVVLNAKNGKIIGSFSSDEPPAFWLTPQGKTVQLSRVGSTVYAIDASTQNILWQFSGDGSLDSSIIVVNGLAVVGSSTGMLYLLDAATGAVAWSENTKTAIGDAGFGVADGMLLVPAGNTLMAYHSPKSQAE